MSLGLPDTILGVAWPSLRRTFGLPLDRLGLLLFAMVAGYLLSSFSSGALTRRHGVGGILVGSSVLVTLGAAGYAAAPLWPLLVLAAFVGGLGGGAIDASINAHAADHFRPGQVVWLHACWGVGAAAGPLIMTAVLQAGLPWRWGYVIVGALVALLGVAFHRTRPLWQGAHAHADAARTATLRASLGTGLVRANVLLFFLYTGSEAAAGQWAFTVLTEGRGMAPASAGLAVGGYWGSVTAGRIVSGWITHHVPPLAVLRAAFVASPACALLFAADAGPAADRAALAGLGFFVGPIFPLLISGTPARVGVAHTANAVGFQVAAAGLGSAALPGLAGVLARAYGVEAIPVLIMVCATAVSLLDAAIRSFERPPTT